MNLSTNAITFGAQLNQAASPARLVRLTNAGNTDLTLSSVAITGVNSSDFVRNSTASTCANGLVLAAQASCDFSLVFQPSVVGGKTAAVTIMRQDSATPVVVALSGVSQDSSPGAVDAAVALALNLSNIAIAAVQNFLAVTYNAFTNLISPEAGPVTALAAAPATTINTANPLNYSNTATWGGALPVAGAGLTIPANTTVILDADTPNLGVLTINGTLKFANQDVRLTASNIIISGTGALMVGDAATPFTNKATITLTGARPNFPADRRIANTRGITVLNGGKLELYGAAPSPVWTQLNDHAAAGATSLTLKDTTNWKADDTVIVGPTDFYGVNPTERLTLATTATGNAIATTAAVNKFRWGKMQYMTDNGLSLTPGTYTPPVLPAPTQLDQRAAVGNLSRNIVIQGANDTNWTNNGFGAHVMVMGLASKVFVDGVEFRRVGQAGAMARYPFHWHMLSYDPATGNYLGDAVGQEIRVGIAAQIAKRQNRQRHHLRPCGRAKAHSTARRWIPHYHAASGKCQHRSPAPKKHTPAHSVLACGRFGNSRLTPHHGANPG